MKEGFRFVIGVTLSEGQRRSTNTLLKLGRFFDPRYDHFDVTQAHFDSFIKNFSANVAGQDLPIDLGHMGDFGGGAGGWFKRLIQDGKRLRVEIEWTELGVEAVIKRGMKYLSASYVEDFVNNETGVHYGPTLLGAGLTIRPVIKGMDAVTLSSAFGGEFNGPILLHDDVIKQLTEERTMKKGEYIERLKKALAEGQVPEGLRIQLSKGAELIITGNESETEIKSIIDAQVGLGKSLAEEMKKGATAPAPVAVASQEKTLSAADIQKIVADGIASAEKAKGDAAKQLSEKKTSNVKLLSDTITAAQGIEDEQKKVLSEALVPTITGFETDDQIKAIVGAQVSLAEKNVAAAKLAGMGYPVTGQVRVEGEGVRGAMKLSEKLDEIFGYAKMPAEKRHPKTGKISLAQKEAAEKVLKHYDQVYGQALAVEAKFGNKMLSGGEVGIADTVLPYTVSRIAIREALYDLQAANIIAIEIESNPKAPTTFIPFVKRQAGNPSRKQITVFEGQPIPYAGLLQDQEMAFVNPRKLATKFTNEVAFFTRSGVIDYDAMRDNMALLSRMLSEGVEYLNLNEMVMAADEFSKAAVVAEDLAAQTADQPDIFQLANWPLVQPRKVFDLKGTQIGNTVNPIVITYEGTARQEYDGTGAQANGVYYVITNWTLGQFKLVDEAGDPQPIAADDTLTVSYSYTTNVLKFDKKLPANTKWEDHLNGLLRLFGRRKATLHQDRYATPNFAYMSAVMNNMLTEASQFESARAKGGTGLTDDGNLEPIKGISCFGSNVPLEQLADLRLIIGQRFTTTQKIAKPWTMEPNFVEVVDPETGRFTGEKQTYGEQYDAIHTPEMLKQQYTEVVAYDSDNDIGPF